MRISDWSSDVCSSDLPASRLLLRMNTAQQAIYLPGPAGIARTGKHLRLRCRSDCGGLFRCEILQDLRHVHAVPGHQDFASGIKAKINALPGIGDNARRSEEHTSELQSLMRISYAVFC